MSAGLFANRAHLCYDGPAGRNRQGSLRSSIGTRIPETNRMAEEKKSRRRILSGMRPTGKLHLGNLVGALQNWGTLQDQYEGYHFGADWHMLTTDYADTSCLQSNVPAMVAEWLAP